MRGKAKEVGRCILRKYTSCSSPACSWRGETADGACLPGIASHLTAAVQAGRAVRGRR